MQEPIESLGLKFARLSLRDRAKVVAELKAKRKLLLIENTKAAGISGVELFNELDAHDQNVWGMDEYIAYANTMEGQIDIIERGYRKANPQGDVDALSAVEENPREAFTLAVAIAGLTLTPADGTEEEPPRPSEPDVYGK